MGRFSAKSVILSFALVYLWSGIGVVHAQAENTPPSTANNSSLKAPLVVPIYPRQTEKEALESIEDLKDKYVVLEDGAVVSMADWVLGSLSKSKVGAGMSDYENRLFLGQVARAVAGLDQDLIYRSFEDAGPPAPYVPHHPPVPLQVAQGLLSMVIPALGPGWKPTIPDPKLTGITDKRSGGTIQFDKQFNEALNQSNFDLFYSGTMQTMLKDAEGN